MRDGRLTNRYARQILEAARQVIGPDLWAQALMDAGLERYQRALPPANLDPGLSFAEISLFCWRLRERFGHNGPQVLRRIGHEMLRRDLEAYGWVANLIRLAVGAPQSPRELVHMALQRAADVVRLETGSAPHVWWDEGYFHWENPSCPYCVGIGSSEPCCDLPAGALEGLIAWVLGKPLDGVQVVEVSCRGVQERACRYRIGWGAEA